ncbi:hypothetical protein AnigIFM59636_000894 [Aspergillus niger]|uniref:Ankyrin repeats (3 copies) family protein n=1 Tax=Aspergillus niger TaxID=5061 RepID=A0A505IU55_ASPNG|nr:Ankyrin repeats (3 copies) family protein [Aspergillus niger]GKZ97508.1 hypothetical protein AnigIFM59636_000894 [Aspergillus niger]
MSSLKQGTRSGPPFGLRPRPKSAQIVPGVPKKAQLCHCPRYMAPNAFDEAVQDVTGVIHTATPFKLHVEDNERDLLQPAIDGTVNILQSIKKLSPAVRRVIITSSFTAIRDPHQGTRPGYIYTEKDWNPVTYEEAAAKDTPGLIAYAAAKTLAEREAWKFMADKNPSFDLVTICPTMVASDLMPVNSSWSWVDARDVALAHLRAFEVPEAGGNRFLVGKGNFSFQQMADILRENLAEVSGRVPGGDPGSGFGTTELYMLDSSKAQNLLGILFRKLNETIVDSVRSLLQLEH